VFHLPILLLQQALELERGTGLGNMWLRPAATVPFMSLPHLETAAQDVLFSSSPIKLNRLVSWSDGAASSSDVAGMQVACPMATPVKD
ncbi:unnamed protein product, partial [Ectocarpus fasciculatus]